MRNFKICILLMLFGLFLVFHNVIADSICILNIGQPGFGQTNPDYTSIRTVILNLSFNENASECRYINYDNAGIAPQNDNENWTSWESCIEQKYWLLSPNDGSKTVYYQVNSSSTSGYSFDDYILYCNFDSDFICEDEEEGINMRNYTYLDTTNNKAYEDRTEASSPAYDTTTEIDDSYSTLVDNDNSYQSYQTIGTDYYPYTRFEMKLDESIADMKNLSLSWVGYGDLVYFGGTEGFNILVFNWVSETWGSKSASTNANEQIVRINITNPLMSGEINETGGMKFVARGPDMSSGEEECGGICYANISTDLVSLEVITDSDLVSGKNKSAVRINSNHSQTLTYPVSGNMELAQGTVEFWTRPDWDKNQGADHCFLHIPTSSGADGFHILYDVDETLIVFKIMGEGKESYVSQPAELTENEWVHITAVWDFEELVGDYNMDLYLDGSNSGNTYYAADNLPEVSDTEGFIYVGSLSNKTVHCNCTIDNFVIFDYARSEQDIYYDWLGEVLSDWSLSLVNDSIYYNHTGAGMDTTAPTAPTIVDGDFTNNCDEVTISWYGAYDFESELLGIPLIYEYYLYNGTDLLASGTTLSTSFPASGPGREHGDNLTVNITVINSGGLKNSSLSDGLVIDLVPPSNIVIQTQKFRNISTGTWMDLPSTGWVNTYDLNFSWYADDVESYISAYSYILTSSQSEEPDDIPEGQQNQLQNETYHVYNGIGSNQFYFKVKARDAGGNWGAVATYSLGVDNTAPIKPVLISRVFNATNKSITYAWSESDDISGVISYRINITITNISGQVDSFETNSTSLKYNISETGDYYAIIGARNGADIWRWSNEEEGAADLTPPIINSYLRGKVITIEPILYVTTDEQAICEYSFDGLTYYNFSYTNTTFHEIMISVSDSTDYNYYIKCADLFGNSDTIGADFTTDTTMEPAEISFAESPWSYEAQKGIIYFNVSSESSDKIGGLKQSDFSLTINDTEHENTFVDLSNGSYAVFFSSPNEPGNYYARVSVKSYSEITPFTVLPLVFSFSYDAGEMLNNVVISSNILVEESNTSSRGLASEQESIILFNTSTSIKAESELGSKLILFSTKDDLNINHRNRYLERQEFLDLITPNFAFLLDDEYILRQILTYNDIHITTSERNELSSGVHTMVIENLNSSDTTLIRLSKTQIYSEKKVFQYD
ncbi:LamG domain-containing protein [Candidatus Woesearchaeota archaeon]|nr:LamG domain-containing protein [Candidatus Woesearchaeota archaeon]